MVRVFRPWLSQLLCMTCVVLASMNSIAQSGNDADTQEVLAYRLTESGLTQYIKATQELSALPGGMPGNCDEDSDAGSIADSVLMINAMPGAEAAIRSAGMTTREYVVFSWSLLSNAMAGWAASEPGGSLPPGTSQANVDFLKSHEAELQRLNASKGSDSCDEGEYDEDEFGDDDYEEDESQ
jgi:hypothetical protein